jgi:hypothetical protein
MKTFEWSATRADLDQADQRCQTGIAVPVPNVATWKYLRALLDTSKENQSFSAMGRLASLPAECVRPIRRIPSAPKGITRCPVADPWPCCALAHPVPGVALATLPVDVLRATPDDCCARPRLGPISSPAG